MLARYLLEGILIVIVITQVVFPIINGTPWFPIFRRRKQEKIFGDLEHARQDLVEDSLEEQLDRLRRIHKEHQLQLAAKPEQQMKDAANMTPQTEEKKEDAESDVSGQRV